MTDEDFADLALEGKWNYLHATMRSVQEMEQEQDTMKRMFSLRRRFNPHHKEEDVEQENTHLQQMLRTLRMDQYKIWVRVKDLYAAHRDELTNRLDNPDYESCASIIERVFTNEVDSALQEILE